MTSPRNEVFQAVPFDATSDAKEPLIATGDAEEEDQGIEERDLSSLKLSCLLMGLSVGVFIQFSTLMANCLAFDVDMQSDDGMQSTTASFFSLLWTLFTSALPFLIISEGLLEDMILQFEYQFGVGVLAGICLTWTIVDVILSTHLHLVGNPFASMVFAFIWYKVTMASATDSKPSSTRRSTAEQTMMTV
jgi:hypothetical protein